MKPASVRVSIEFITIVRSSTVMLSYLATMSATGLPLDHVNAHKHMHLHPTVARLIVEIGREYGLAAMRLPYEPPAESPRKTSDRTGACRCEVPRYVAPDRASAAIWSARTLDGPLPNLPSAGLISGGMTTMLTPSAYPRPPIGPDRPRAGAGTTAPGAPARTWGARRKAGASILPRPWS